MAKKQELATQPDALPANIAAMNAAFESEAGAGLENVTAQDLLVPRLAILQSLSPQLIKSKSEYIKEAQAGDICDTATRELWKDTITVLPVYFDKKWLEWKPRSQGGGLVTIHDDNAFLSDCTKNDKGQYRTKSGNEVVESMQFYVLNLSAEGRRSFIAMSSTQAKKAKMWITFITNERVTNAQGKRFQPPVYYRTYQLSPAEQSNTQGAWFGWNIERGPSLPELGADGALLHAEAKAFREGLISGSIKIRDEQIADTGATHDDGEVM